MIVSINQPAYLPWLGYFHRIAVSDVHIVLDHVQFEKNSFINRNKVRTVNGWCWLSVPVQTAGRFPDIPINQLTIADDGRWARKHWLTVSQCYVRAPYFSDHARFFEQIYSRKWVRLVDLCHDITSYLLDAFRISTPLRYSSGIPVGGRKSELILNLCVAVGATTYLSGPLGRDYLDEAAFRARGIRVEYADFKHPVYPQVHGGFEPNMAAIDLLFNCGPRSRDILLGHTGEGGR